MKNSLNYYLNEAINLRAIENDSNLNIDFRFTLDFCAKYECQEEPPIEWDIAGRSAEERTMTKEEWKSKYSEYRGRPEFAKYGDLKPAEKLSELIDFNECHVNTKNLGADGMAMVYDIM